VIATEINAPAVEMPIAAWRIARLMRLGRACPDLDAALLFSPKKWHAGYIPRTTRPPKQA